MVRLDRLLSEVLGCSAKAAQRRITDGEVSVAGVPVCEPRWQVVLKEALKVSVCGTPLPEVMGGRRPFEHKLYLIHKPKKTVCERFRGSASWLASRGREHGYAPPPTAKEAACIERGSRSIYDIVPEQYRHPHLCLYGRLDMDTTGLMLMGTDGGLQSLLMHPSCECEKAYIATCAPAGREERLASLATCFANTLLSC
jgi:16S rRNA U516 pseudouridylate synthase RsuA-like enzyme